MLKKIEQYKQDLTKVRNLIDTMDNNIANFFNELQVHTENVTIYCTKNDALDIKVFLELKNHATFQCNLNQLEEILTAIQLFRDKVNEVNEK